MYETSMPNCLSSTRIICKDGGRQADVKAIIGFVPTPRSMQSPTVVLTFAQKLFVLEIFETFIHLFSRHAYPRGVAGAAAGVETSKHLDPLQQRIDTLLNAKARPTKIFYVISPSSCGTAFRPSTHRC